MLTDPYWLDRVEQGLKVREIYSLDKQLYDGVYNRITYLRGANPKDSIDLSKPLTVRKLRALASENELVVIKVASRKRSQDANLPKIARSPRVVNISKPDGDKPPVLFENRPTKTGVILFMLTDPYWLNKIDQGVTMKDVFSLDNKLHSALFGRRFFIGRTDPGKKINMTGLVTAQTLGQLALDSELEVLTAVPGNPAPATPPSNTVQTSQPPNEKQAASSPRFVAFTGGNVFKHVRTHYAQDLAEGLPTLHLEPRDKQAYNALFNAWEATFDKKTAMRNRPRSERLAEFNRVEITDDVLTFWEHPLGGLGHRPAQPGGKTPTTH